MSSRQLLFNVFYRLGFAPWDGHPLGTSLRDVIAGSDPLPPGTALDIGCGTGDNAIYLATHGWRVTAVDFVEKPLARARAKAAANKVDITFARADATRLGSAGAGTNFDLIIDYGCLHGMSSEDRDAYVREVTKVAAPRGRLLIAAFIPGGSFAVPGIDPAEVQQRFARGWTLLAKGDEPSMDHNGRNPGRYFLFERAA